MSDGLKTTFELLTDTANVAAVQVLLAGLDSPRQSIRDGALKGLLARRDGAGHREILRRLPAFDDRWRAMVRGEQGRFTPSIRNAILSADPPTCAHGCRAAVWFQEYELIPALVTALEDPAHASAAALAEAIRELSLRMYADLASGEPRSGGVFGLRSHVVAALEKSVTRYGKHRRRAILEAFLLLVGRDNATLVNLVQDVFHPAFAETTEILLHCPEAGVIRLVLSFLDQPHAPSAVISIAARRADLPFLQYLLRKVGREPSRAVSQNLKRMTSPCWLGDGPAALDRLADAAQHAAVRVVMHSGIARSEAFAVVEHLLVRGKPGGRRAAAQALAQFQGAQANALALRALEDPDPQVQAAALAQLRGRSIPAALARLVDMLDSPHAVVRKAARKSLEEFTCRRFLAAWDMLDEEVRLSTGSLVKKVDRQTIPILQGELASSMRSRRMRALAVARTLELIPKLEPAVLHLLEDEDHVVRAEAAAALGQGHSPQSRRALQMALFDRSATVQEAARKSLARRADSTGRPEEASAAKEESQVAP